MDLLLAKATKAEEGILILHKIKREKKNICMPWSAKMNFFNGQYQYLVKTDSGLFADSGNDESKKKKKPVVFSGQTARLLADVTVLKWTNIN